MSSKRIDLQSIQFGTLNNGIFEKTEVEAEKSSIDETPSGKLQLKRYSSSLFWYLLISWSKLVRNDKLTLKKYNCIIYSFIRESYVWAQLKVAAHLRLTKTYLKRSSRNFPTYFIGLIWSKYPNFPPSWPPLKNASIIYTHQCIFLTASTASFKPFQTILSANPQNRALQPHADHLNSHWLRISEDRSSTSRKHQ